MTNTGITSVVYADGTESKRLNVGEHKILDLDLYSKKRSKTIFQQIGFLMISLFISLYMGLIYIIEVRTTKT